MPTQIRGVRRGDGASLYRVFVAAVYQLANRSYSKPQLDAWVSGISADRLEVRALSMNSYVAVCDDRVIGFSSLDVHQGELDYLYVDPEFAGQGIARRLTARVEREAVRNGLEDLALTASINALPAYERLGYHRVSNFEKTIRGVPIPCVRMTKHLGGNR